MVNDCDRDFNPPGISCIDHGGTGFSESIQQLKQHNWIQSRRFATSEALWLQMQRLNLKGLRSPRQITQEELDETLSCCDLFVLGAFILPAAAQDHENYRGL